MLCGTWRQANVNSEPTAFRKPKIRPATTPPATTRRCREYSQPFPAGRPPGRRSSSPGTGCGLGQPGRGRLASVGQCRNFAQKDRLRLRCRRPQLATPATWSHRLSIPRTHLSGAGRFFSLNTAVVFNPVGKIFPATIRKDEPHSRSGSSRSAPPPARSCSTASRNRRAFSGLRRR